ncbi:tetrahydroberberine oxidase-like [Apium graveolens]|uniref:tetrahydroberberine oxidase-like n=1 Tax=Apium graveolens TaxID=4045 RepID=UPI003D7B46C9
MKPSLLISFVLLLLTFLCAAPSALSKDKDPPKKFVKCLNRHSSDIYKLVYTQQTPNFTQTLLYTINNLRFAKPETPKPLVIVTPVTESQIQTVIYCSKKHDMPMRIRSGGHSFEGLSYVSPIPFVILDIVNLKTFSFDAGSQTAWIGSGLTNGELYYRIGEKTDSLGFPSGLFGNVGVGGLLSGGGYGMMMRKYGLAADHVIDARLIDANGRILDRKLMGEDWFWAIRGGGGGSFGVVLSWKVRLVPVPKILTVYKVFRTVEQNLTTIFHRYQSVATKFPKELNIKADGQSIVSNASPRSDKRTMIFLFQGMYLGRVDKMLSLMQDQFPELGVVREDCFEVSWLQAMVYFSGFELFTPPEILLNLTVLPRPAFKSNNDYTQVPIPIEGLEGLWDMMYKLPPQKATLQFTPYGGRMDEISESALPFPYRAGTLFKFNRFAETDTDEAERMEWIKSLAIYLTPYVTKNPRSAYVNYVDLTMGSNNLEGTTSYQQASRWGRRYFKNNFDKLVKIKSVVDPDNFFRHEQSIPPLISV